MFCKDLSPYHYHGCPTGLQGTRNVGWLGQSAPFTTGGIPANLIDDIRRFSKTTVRLMRGFHSCEFCSKSARAKGNGELWLRSPNGPIYVAPQLLEHYMEEHNYLPLTEFLTIFDSTVQAVPEVECNRMIQEQQQRPAKNHLE